MNGFLDRVVLDDLPVSPSEEFAAKLEHSLLQMGFPVKVEYSNKNDFIYESRYIITRLDAYEE